jgi:LAS superfamily LD-carboxypeptidase LdcB
LKRIVAPIFAEYAAPVHAALAVLLTACSGPPDADGALVASSSPEPPASLFVTPARGAPPPAAAPAEFPAGDPAATEPPATETATLSPRHIPLNFLIGRIDPSKEASFARIPDKYVSGSRVWGHKDAVEALIRMVEAADRNGYKLRVVSAFRSFDDQKDIWEDKWTGKTLVEGKKLPSSTPDPKARSLKILEFSAMPGASRHHWGTDFDFNSLSNSYFRSGEGKRIYDWLTQHAAAYGFCQVYTAKGADRPNGYEEEKWHWSYMPVASWYLRQYPEDVGYERLAGFEGAETARDLGVIANYVEAINPECR